MHLQGRELAFDMVGDDITVLHQELIQIGFTIPNDELKERIFGEATQKAVIEFQRRHRLPDTGVVDEATAAAINAALEPSPPLPQLIVHGHVTRSDSRPFTRMLVRAYDKDLRTEELLGAIITNSDGYYEIPYTAEKFTRAEKGGADLRISVCTESGTELLSSPILFNAQAVETVDIRVDDNVLGLSEYERLLQELTPVLQEVLLHELTSEDTEFLAGETGQERQHIFWLAESARRVEETKLLDPTIHTHVAYMRLPLWLFYGWFRQGLSMNYGEIMKRPVDELITSLQRATDQNIIPTTMHAIEPTLRADLEQRRIDDALRPAQEGGIATIGDILRTIPAAADLKLSDPEGPGQKITAILLDATLDEPEILVRVLTAAGEKLSPFIERTLSLKQLTLDYAPVIQELQRSQVNEIEAHLEDLVSLDTQDWLALAEKYGVPKIVEGDTDALRQKIYAERMARTVQLMHPTPYMLHRIETDQVPMKEEVKEPLAKFLRLNDQFHLGEQSVLGLFQSAAIKTDGIAPDDLQPIQDEMLRLERVAKISPSLEHVGPLLDLGYDSARKITQRSRDAFLEEAATIQVDSSAAMEIYARAEETVAAATGLILTYSPHFNPNAVLAIPTTQPMQPISDLHSAGLPASLRQLFGPSDYCECAHGTSLYGPAAYLADLLNMLDSGPRNGQGQTPLDVLIHPQRRPDLAEIDLTYENAETPLPYIDLSLEMLEAPLAEAALGVRVARGSQYPDGTIHDWEYDDELTQGRVPNGLRSELATWGIVLSKDARAYKGGGWVNSAGVSFLNWLVRDDAIKINLIGIVPGFYRIMVWPQSQAPAKSPSTTLPFVLAHRYVPLAQARYPWSLPFDLRREECNAWLSHLGVPRYELIQAFEGMNLWQSVEAACELLNINPSVNAILTTETAQPFLDWGFEAASPQIPIDDPIAGHQRGPGLWSDLLKHVSLLRARARLTHRELLNLLETRFIQNAPNLLGKLELSGDECDTAAMRLETLNEAAVRRIHLFIRLWRQLGWSVFDVDRAITAHTSPLSVTNNVESFSESLMVFCANIVRIQQQTALPVGRIINLFRPRLDTWAYWDHSGSEPRREPSIYEGVFLNASVARPMAMEFKLDDSGKSLKLPAPSSGLPQLRLRDHLSYLAASLGVKVNDLLALLPAEKYTLPPDRLSSKQIGASVWIADLDSVIVELLFGELTGKNAEITVQIEHSSDAQAFSPVPSSDLSLLAGNLPLLLNPVVITIANTWQLVHARYTGDQPYLRVSVTHLDGTNPMAWIAARILRGQSLLEDRLSLESLSKTFKYIVLARCLKLPVSEALALREVSGLNPYSTPEVMLDLLDALRLLRAFGFSMSDMDFLLRHNYSDDELRTQEEELAAVMLNAIRIGLQAIREDTTAAPDKSCDLVRKLLAWLGWNTELIEGVLGPDYFDSPWQDYEAKLDTLPIPSVGPTFHYDSIRKALTAPGSTRPVDIDNAIQTIRQGTDYQTLAPADRALMDTAFDAITAQVAQREEASKNLRAMMRCLTLPTHTAPLVATYIWMGTIPAVWAGRFYYDPAGHALNFVGWMTEGEKLALSVLRPQADTEYSDALEILFGASKHYQETLSTNRLVVEENVAGLDALTAEALLLDHRTLQDRCSLLLKFIVPSVRRNRAESLVVEKLAVGFSTTEPVIKSLLSGLTIGTLSVLEAVFLNRAFAESDSAVSMTSASFLEQFDALVRINKLSVLATRLRLGSATIPWLMGAWNGINLSGLPVKALSGIAPGWPSVIALMRIVSGQKDFFGDPTDLEKVRQASFIPTPEERIRALAQSLGWDGDDLSLLLEVIGLSMLTASDLREPDKVQVLMAALAIARKLGASASTLVGWKRVNVTAQEAQAARQLVRARYSDDDWDKAAGPILDQLKAQRRDALVAYLVQHHAVRDANDLFGHYLIDPEMGTCMMTSRIKQAISSVQLFIQRCFMRLEPDVSPSTINVDRWKWMKNYRVWEANRKVLLYPENWIEPELRDDKSPFFKELEGELLQGDITDETATIAMRGFLDKLLDVSRLEVVGMWRHINDNGLETLHVFGRTRSEPHQYYYRRFNKLEATGTRGYWTPWEKVDLDIEGDHLIPVQWRGRLLVFWPIFSEEAETPAGSSPSNTPPRKLLNVKFAWSEYRNGKWLSRRVSDRLVFRIALYTKYEGGVDNFTADTFHFLAEVRKGGIAIQVHALAPDLLYPFTNSSPLSDLFSSAVGQPINPPLATLCFDGQRLFQVAVFSSVDELVWDQELLPSPIVAPVVKDIGSVAKMPHEDSVLKITDESGGPLPLLDNTPRPYWLMHSGQDVDVKFRPAPGILYLGSPGALSFFFEDGFRQFFVYPTQQLLRVRDPITELITFLIKPWLSFIAFDLTHATRLKQALSEQSVDGLLRFDVQYEPQYDPQKMPDGLQGSFAIYKPSGAVGERPSDDVDFSLEGAYSSYNWELFFQLPFAVACHLSKNQRFEEARRWFHFIFDPTDNSSRPSPQRYWHFRPFAEEGTELPIEQLIYRLADKNDRSEEKRRFEILIAQWKVNPFKPHVVARMRPRAYMYAVVMKYLDNLIAWGDQLFRRETLEALNEAAQMYVLAAQILGRRPEAIPPRTRPQVKSFGELRSDLDDALSNALVQSENILPATVSGTGVGGGASAPLLPSLYFCVPGNARLADYYDLVEDRLYNLRNCMNIEGVVRQLPLFGPPIDPGLLVKAAAAGVDIAAVLADSDTPTPRYRFSVMSQKASELCAEVKSLGTTLLSAIEKRDAEALSVLRSGHEIKLLEHIRFVKELQIEEARANIEAMGTSLEAAQKRLTYHLGLLSSLESLNIPTGPAGPRVQSLAAAALEPIGKTTALVQGITAPVIPAAAASMELLKQVLNRTAEAISATLPAQGGETSKVPMIPAEKNQLDELKAAHDLQQKAMDQRLVAQIMARIPDFTLGTEGMSSPVITAQLGGSLLSAVANFEASKVDSQANEHSYRANLHSILAGYQRRAAEWTQQAELATLEIQQITKQLSALGLRLAMAAQELRNHDQQITNTHDVDTFLREKYSNADLYIWMTGQIAGVYFRSYQLAYDVARRAEGAYRDELGLTDSNFVQFGYWDSLKKGLLAGDHLFQDIKRMEVAFLEWNRREYEITKHVSLAQLNPLALLELKETGMCEFEIPEAVFDFDFPGHYFRRLKSLSISVPCVVGPYTSVSGTLTLLASWLRRKATSTNYTADDLEASHVPLQSIASSMGQNESGLFDLNFRDERYLPFEGAGAISRWRFTLPDEFRSFDYDTISDVILHLHYTARDGGMILRDKATENLQAQIANATAAGMVRLFSIRHEFPTEWAAFKSAKTPDARLTLNFRAEHYPFWSQGRLSAVKQAGVFVQTAKNEVKIANKPVPAAGTRPDPTRKVDTINVRPWKKILGGELTNLPPPIGESILYFDDNSMEDLWLVLVWSQ